MQPRQTTPTRDTATGRFTSAKGAIMDDATEEITQREPEASLKETRQGVEQDVEQDVAQGVAQDVETDAEAETNVLDAASETLPVRHIATLEEIQKSGGLRFLEDWVKVYPSGFPLPEEFCPERQANFLACPTFRASWVFLVRYGLIPLWSMRLAQLQDLQLQHTSISRAIFDVADFESSNLSFGWWIDCSFRKACLQKIVAEGTYFRGSAFDEADLRRANLTRSKLNKCSFKGAEMGSIVLHGACAQRANFEGANLQGADLRGADLRSSNFQGADLAGANLSGADFRGVNLREANLAHATITGIKFSGAKVAGVYLKGIPASDENKLLTKMRDEQGGGKS